MKIVVFLVAAVYSVAGLAISNGRIAGGSLAAVGEFPYVVSVTDNGRHFCGGWIYSESWVVTAASCVFGKTAGALKVVAGQVSLTNADPAEQTLAVYSIYIFDQYNSTTKANDIALLKLTTPIRFDNDDDATNNPPTGPLNVDYTTYNEVDPDIVTGTVMGWGATLAGGFESINLRSGGVDFPAATVDPDPCAAEYGAEYVPATMICAKGSATAPTGSPCQYDEGSPLVQINADSKHVVVGIVSRIDLSKGCNVDPTFPAVYTRVSVFYSWLLRTAGAQPSPPLAQVKRID